MSLFNEDDHLAVLIRKESEGWFDTGWNGLASEADDLADAIRAAGYVKLGDIDQAALANRLYEMIPISRFSCGVVADKIIEFLDDDGGQE